MLREPSSPEGRLPWLLAVGTLPIVIAGLLLKKHIEGDLRSLYVIAGALIVVGIAMAIVDRYASGRDEHRPLATITYTDAILVGLAQTLALVPGVSRSGATICMTLLLGFARSDAARFSFLLSIPAIAGAGIFEARDAFRMLGSGAIPALLVGTATAAVSGYAVDRVADQVARIARSGRLRDLPGRRGAGAARRAAPWFAVGGLPDDVTHR